MSVRAHFVVKDVTGTFATGNSLTTHTGTVKGWDADTQILDTTFENVIRFEQEQDGTFNEGIQLEQGTPEQELGSIVLETEQDFADGENIIMDGTGTFTPSPQTVTLKVKVVRNVDDTANIFTINDEAQPTLALYAGNTYYFDLSDSSLYNVVETKNHQLRFSKTSDGTHSSGVAYTTGVTTSATSIDIGTAGAYIQIQVAYAVQGLYYYCVNHSGMGGRALTPHYETTITDAGSNIVFDSTDRGPNIALMLLNETGDVGANDTDNVILEDDSGDIHLEETIDGLLSDVGDNLLIDRYHERNNSQFLLLDGTDSSGANAGDRVANESSGQGSVILNGTDADSTDVMGSLLLSDETGNGQLILNGTTNLFTDIDGHIINEDPIDFSKQNVTITDSGGASATIVNADIAKGSTSIGTQAETIPSYGSNIESLVGEDLNRLQDSVFYQQFSYEIEAPASGGDYLPQLKKAVHPAGFNVFGKVAIATSISAGIGLTGSSLGGGYTADTDSFSPILASTFTILFDEKVSSRMGVSVGYGVNNFDDEILLETDDSELGDFVLNQTDSSGTDSGYRLVSETLPLNFIDFDGISITHGTQAGEFGVLVDETDGDKIISESAETISNSLLIDSTPDSNHIIPTDAGSAFLLNRTDSSGTDAGDNIELEQVLCDTTSFFTFQTQGAGATDSLVNEDGGNQQLETSGKGSEGNFERSIISRVERKISLPNVQVASLSTGLITLAQSPFVGHTDGGGIELELGTATSGVLILNGFELVNAKGGVNTVISGGEFQLEEWTDQNYDSGFAFDQFANYTSDSIVLDGTDGSSTNAGDNILIDNYDETGRFYQARLEGEAVFNYNYFTLGDLIRPSIFVIDPVGGGELFGILQETDEIGSFRQEDGTTVAGTHGDEILLEDETGVGRNNKLSLEFQRIVPEDEVLKRDTHGFELTGTIPPENFTNSDVEPFVYPSEIESRNIGTTILEETIFEVTNIQLESGTNNALGGAVGNLVLDSSEDTSLGATDENAPIQMETSESIFRDHADGNIVLNGTDGSSTNADGNILHDAGTFLDILNNAAVIIDTSSEGGFDSSQFKFDTVQKTFDSTI